LPGQAYGDQESQGHHYIPRELFDNKDDPFRAETRKVFEKTTTGPLLDSRSNRGYDREHRIYNQAVDELFTDFKARNGFQKNIEVLPDHAERFLSEVFDSKDSRIQRMNMRFILREIMRRVPSFPRGNE
jgi:hypothetical protein